MEHLQVTLDNLISASKTEEEISTENIKSVWIKDLCHNNCNSLLFWVCNWISHCRFMCIKILGKKKKRKKKIKLTLSSTPQKLCTVNSKSSITSTYVIHKESDFKTNSFQFKQNAHWSVNMKENRKPINNNFN